MKVRKRALMAILTYAVGIKYDHDSDDVITICLIYRTLFDLYQTFQVQKNISSMVDTGD